MIMYQAGKQNSKADTLTRRDDKVEAQDGVKAEYQTKAFLSQDQINLQVLQDLRIDVAVVDTLLLIEEGEFNELIRLIDCILQANHTSQSLDIL